MALLVWGIAAGIGLVTFSLERAGLRYNTSPSVPIGFWWIQPLQADLKRGDVVEVCPPNTAVLKAADKRWGFSPGPCPGGYRRFLKPIGALPGDLVEVHPSGISINNVQVSRTQFSLPPAPFNQWLKRYWVPQGMVFLLSTYTSKSFDSRYFGPVTVGNIRGSAKLLWSPLGNN